MVLGSMLKDRDQQYVASKDENTRTWRILDTWSEELKTIGVEDEIPDDSPSVTVLTEGAFIALIKEAARVGVLENASLGGGGGEEVDTEEATQLEQELSEIREKAVKYEEENNSLRYKLQESQNLSEPFKIKSKAMEAVLKLAAMSDIERISED